MEQAVQIPVSRGEASAKAQDEGEFAAEAARAIRARGGHVQGEEVAALL